MDNGSLFDPPDQSQGGPTQELAPFEFPFTGHQVRSILIGDEPWFVAADVCAVLAIGNARQAVSYLDEDEVRQEPVTTNDGSGRVVPTNLINESGLYSLILRSRKPEAKTFKKWITVEVLPAIRKTGGYSIAVPAPRGELSNRDLAMMVIEEADRADRAESRAKELEAPAELAATYAAANSTTTIRAFARTVQQWGQARGLKILQSHVFDFLGHIGMIIRSNTSEHGQATAAAIKAGWCENATTDYATMTRGAMLTTYAKLTAKGVDHAWKRIHSAIGQYGALDSKLIR